MEIIRDREDELPLEDMTEGLQQGENLDKFSILHKFLKAGFLKVTSTIQNNQKLDTIMKMKTWTRATEEVYRSTFENEALTADQRARIKEKVERINAIAEDQINDYLTYRKSAKGFMSKMIADTLKEHPEEEKGKLDRFLRPQD